MISASVRSRALPVIAAFTAGGIGGALLDQIHVHAHVLAYAHPDLAGQPWWVAPQFGAAVVAILATAIAGVRAAGPTSDRVPLVFDALVFVAAYGVTAALRAHPWAVVVIVLALWGALVSLHRDRARLLFVSIVLAVIGPAYESALTATGAFHYVVPGLVLRVPVWLPALYLVAGVLAGNAARVVGRAFDGSDALKPSVAGFTARPGNE